MLLLTSFILAVLMAAVLFRLFFSNLVEMVEAIYRPDFSTLKLVIWAALAIAMGFGAYHTLPRHIPLFARQHKSKPATATNEAKSAVAQASTTSAALAHSPATPDSAAVHGFKVGDTVQISSIQPPIALRSAVITSIDQTQVVVRAISGSYTSLWKDLAGIKPASTNSAR